MNIIGKVICNVKNPSNHCNYQCRHGTPHFKDRTPDLNCEKTNEYCGLSKSKRRVKVHCRKLNKNEIKKWLLEIIGPKPCEFKKG